jgi:ribosome-binding protein aMBF1 (putative translation factor)
MKSSKQKKLAQAGWKVGSAADFLGLSHAEEMLVNIKVALAARVKERREALALTQMELAKRLGSSQSRIAKIEAADHSVSLDLLVRSLASLGGSQEDISEAIRPKRTPKRKKTPAKNS